MCGHEEMGQYETLDLFFFTYEMTLLWLLFDQDIWMKGQKLHSENGCDKVEIESLIFSWVG